jgi:hypothetical protein
MIDARRAITDQFFWPRAARKPWTDQRTLPRVCSATVFGDPVLFEDRSLTLGRYDSIRPGGCALSVMPSSRPITIPAVKARSAAVQKCFRFRSWWRLIVAASHRLRQQRIQQGEPIDGSENSLAPAPAIRSATRCKRTMRRKQSVGRGSKHGSSSDDAKTARC